MMAFQEEAEGNCYQTRSSVLTQSISEEERIDIQQYFEGRRGDAKLLRRKLTAELIYVIATKGETAICKKWLSDHKGGSCWLVSFYHTASTLTLRRKKLLSDSKYLRDLVEAIEETDRGWKNRLDGLAAHLNTGSARSQSSIDDEVDDISSASQLTGGLPSSSVSVASHESTPVCPESGPSRRSERYRRGHRQTLDMDLSEESSRLGVANLMADVLNGHPAFTLLAKGFQNLSFGGFSLLRKTQLLAVL